MKNHINPTEIACAIPSLEKLLYIKESQRLCQSVVNLAMQVYEDLITLSLPCLHREMMEPGCRPGLTGLRSVLVSGAGFTDKT